MKESILSKCYEIEAIIGQSLSDGYPQHDGLAAGKAGIILFYTEMCEFTGDEDYLDKGISLLEGIINSYRFDPGLYSHCAGVAGLMWIVGYLVRKEYIDPSCYDTFDEIEQPLFEKMLSLLDAGLYDFLHEGLSIYHGFAANDSLRFDREDLIETTLGFLEKTGVQDESGLRWNDINLQTNKPIPGTCNFGMAHGIGSIISLMSQMYSMTTSQRTRERIFQLVSGAMSFLFHGRSPEPETLSLFPYVIFPGRDIDYNSRLGWCYGDLGIAIAIRNAGKAFQQLQWLDMANEIVGISTRRKDLARNQIFDGGFCHGAGGLAHIYMSFYLESGDEAQAEAARYWSEKTLALAVHKDGLAGYKSFSAELGYVNNIGLLEGVTGTALCLLSALSEKKTDWDRVWLIF